jgi:hypothetical protein
MGKSNFDVVISLTIIFDEVITIDFRRSDYSTFSFV